MTALVRSELLKVRTTRGWYVYLALIVLLTGLAVAGDIGTAGDDLRSALDFQVGLVEAAGLGSLLAIILGITVVTNEFRHGTITPTFLVTPRREWVVVAKALSTAGIAVLFAVLGLVIVVAVAVPWLSAIGADLHLDDQDVAVRAAQTVLVSVLWGLLGVAIGAVVHSQIAALVGTLLWVFLAETLIVGVLGLLDVDGIAAYLPFQALDAADGTGGDNLLSYWSAVAVSLAWIAVLGAAGTERTRRRDIT